MKYIQAIKAYCSFVAPTNFKEAHLVLLWCFMTFLYANYLDHYTVAMLYQWNITFLYKPYILIRWLPCLHYIISPLYPLVGMIADVWTGRYCVIVVSIYCCFTGWVITVVSYFIMKVQVASAVFLIMGLLFQFVGVAGFHSNILAFLIDQVIGASGDELTSLTYWYCLSYALATAAMNVMACVTSDDNWNQTSIMCILISGTSVTITMSSYYLFKDILDTHPRISNPIKLIFKVLNYARKTKYPENRSALTYYQDEAPSRVDLGKDKYGGPFTEEQVEDVKTVLRFLPLLVSIIGLVVSIQAISYVSYLTGTNDTAQLQAKHIMYCLLDNKGIFNITVLLFTLTFKMIILPCFNKYIPSMLKRIQIGLGICLLSVLMYLAIDVAASLKGTDNSCWLNTTQHHNATAGIHYHWVLLPEIFSGVGFSLGLSAIIELTIAQSPGHMRGLMCGIWYGVLGIGLIFCHLFYVPFGSIDFSFLPASLSCTFFCNVNKLVWVLLILLLFKCLAGSYKLRVREDVADIYNIVSETYTRYFNQQSNEDCTID